MEFLKDKKKVGLVCIVVIISMVTIFSYIKNKSKVFKDECMEDIFVEEVDTNNESKVTKIDLKNEEKLIIVEIKGEVINPDVYTLNENSVVKDLIDIAGGLTSEANITNINRAKKLQNHELIIISNENDVNELTEVNVSNPTENQDGLININTGTLEELMKIPGVGQVKAQSIIDYREENGGFKSIEEIMNISGIGSKTFEKLKDSITL